ncbi:band-7 C-terminal domain-containing protein, partial [Leptospira interrogans]
DAIKLRIGQKFIKEFEKISGKKTEIVLPLNLANFRSILKSVLGNEDQKN